MVAESFSSGESLLQEPPQAAAPPAQELFPAGLLPAELLAVDLSPAEVLPAESHSKVSHPEHQQQQIPQQEQLPQPLEGLPNELIHEVISRLQIQELVSTSLLSRRFHNAVEPFLYSTPLTTKHKAAYILRTLIHRPELGYRFKSLYLEKPDDWFTPPGGNRRVMERVDLRNIFGWEEWLILKHDSWGQCLNETLNWDAAMGSLIKRMPNLESLHVGYHGAKLYHLHQTLTRAAGFQRLPDPQFANFALPNLRSITHHTNDGAVTLSHLLPFLMLPSLQTFVCEGVKSKELGTFIVRTINVRTMTLTLCAIRGPDLERFLPKCTSLKSLTLQNGNYDIQHRRAHFPLSSILAGLHNVKHILEELKITDLANWGSTLGHLQTCSFNKFSKLRHLEIQTEQFFSRPVTNMDGSSLFNFTHLPPNLEKLTLRVTHVHLTSQIRDELQANLVYLPAVPKLKGVHTRFLQQDGVRRQKCWPRLTRRYLETAGVKLTFDFWGHMSDEQIVAFKEGDLGWLEPEESKELKEPWDAPWGSDVATPGSFEEDTYPW